MSAAHTPGPWRWELNPSAKGIYLAGGKPRFDKTVMQFGRWGMHRAIPLFNSHITGNQFNVMERVCDVPGWTKPFQGREHHADWCLDVVHPDARLMAAAPELLEALKALIRVDPAAKFFCEPGSPMGLAHAAIAKATGATQ